MKATAKTADHRLSPDIAARVDAIDWTQATADLDGHVSTARGVDDALEGARAGAKLRELLATLPEIDRSILLLRFDHELPFEEIGIALGIRGDNAKVRAHRALARLRPKLREMGVEP